APPLHRLDVVHEVVGDVIGEAGDQLRVGQLDRGPPDESQDRRIPPRHASGIIGERHARRAHGDLPGSGLDVERAGGPLCPGVDRERKPQQDGCQTKSMSHETPPETRDTPLWECETGILHRDPKACFKVFSGPGRGATPWRTLHEPPGRYRPTMTKRPSPMARDRALLLPSGSRTLAWTWNR